MPSAPNYKWSNLVGIGMLCGAGSHDIGLRNNTLNTIFKMGSNKMLPENSEQLYSEFTDVIDSYIRERFGYKAKCAEGWRPTINVSRRKVRLYLRFRGGGSWPENVLVIASIEFREQRVGHCRALLEKLVAESTRFGYGHIAFEQTHSPMMVNFVQKYGFTAHHNNKNWIISVGALSTRLDLVPQTKSLSRQARQHSAPG